MKKKDKIIVLALVMFLLGGGAFAQLPPGPPGAIYDEGAVVGMEGALPDNETSRAIRALESARERQQRREFAPVGNENMRPESWDVPYEGAVVPEPPAAAAMTEAEMPDRTILLSDDILYFFSYIELSSDGKMIITDTIKLGRNTSYKNGFERNFPTSYRNVQGNMVNSSINVVSAAFNGSAIPFSMKIADGNVVVDLEYTPEYFTEEVNTIVLSYRVADNFTFQGDETEMFWEVIGRGWDKSVLNLGAAIVFIKGMEVTEKVAFISDKPEQAAFRVSTDVEGNVGFIADQPLSPHESFTLYIKWKRGPINEMSSKFSDEVLFEKYGVFLASIGAAVLMVIYYLLLPLLIRKDRDFWTKRIGSLRTLSPAALRYVLRRRFDSKVLTVSVLDMMIKSSSALEEADGGFSIKGNLKKGKKLSGISGFIFSHLFTRKRHTLSLQAAADKARIKKASRNIPFLSVLETEKFFLKQNAKFIMVAFMFSLIAAVSGAVMTNFPVQISLYGVAFVVGSFGFLFASYLVLKSVRRVKSLVVGKFAALVLVALVFLGIAVCGGCLLADVLRIYTVAALLVMPVVALIAHITFKSSANTAKYIHDGFNSFKAMLSTSVDVANEKRSWAAFDRYLPYALALDMEVEYNDRYFADGSPEALGHALEYLPASYRTAAKFVQNLSSGLEALLA